MTTVPVGSTLFNGIQFTDPNDVEAQLLNLGATRTGVLEDAVRFNNQEQQARTQQVNDLNRAFALLQNARPQFDTAGSQLGDAPGNRRLTSSEITFIRNTLSDDPNESIPDPFDRFTNINASNVPEVAADGDFQRLLNATRDQVDRASANSQLELIQLQALINRRNQAVEFTTNLVQRFSSLRDRIIGNFRS